MANPKAKKDTGKKKGLIGLILIVILLLLILAGGIIWALDYLGVMSLHSVPVLGPVLAGEERDPLAADKQRLEQWEASLAEKESQLLERETQIRQQEADLSQREAELQQRVLQLEEQKDVLLELQQVDYRLQQLADLYSSMMPAQAASSLRHINNELLREIVGRMDSERAADVVSRLPEQKAASLVKVMGDEQGIATDPEREQIVSMAEMYSKMEPQVAAESIRVLDDSLAAKILAEMTPENAMLVLSELPPHSASHLVSVMAGSGSSELDHERERQLRSLAQLYSGLTTQQAVASLEAIDETLAVNILRRMGQADVQRLFDSMDTFKVARMVALMANEEVSDLEEYDPYRYNVGYIAALVSKMSGEEAVQVFEGMDSAFVTEVIKELPPQKATELLVALHQEDAAEVMINLSGALGQLGELKEEQRFNQLVDIFAGMESTEAAAFIQQMGDDLMAVKVLMALESQQAGEILSALPKTTGVRYSKLMVDSYTGGSQHRYIMAEMFKLLDAAEVADLIVGEMPDDEEVARILMILPDQRAAEIVQAIKDADPTRAASILEHMG